MPGPVAMQGVIRHICRTEFRRLYQLLGDSELLARFLSDRDEAAFEEIVSRHGPMVRAVCRRMLGPTADADDAFQATFLVFIRKARSIRRTNLLANWLCAVAYRTARQALRRRWRLGTREQNVELLPEPGRIDDPPRDWLPLFDAALQRLPSRYREAVVLCDLQGLARSDAASKLGVNEGTLSSRLGRGRDLLRKRLVRHGFPLAIGSALAPAIVPEALTASTVAAAMSPATASVTATVLTEGVVTAMFASKLKAGLACAAVLFVGAFAGWQFTGPATVAGGPPAKSGPAPKSSPMTSVTPGSDAPDPKPSQLAQDYEQFQGEWLVVSAESNKGTGVEAVGVDEVWKFTGSMLATGGELKEDATEKFVVNGQAKPATIDFTLVQFAAEGTGAFVRTPYQGIFKFETDGSLQICYRIKADGFIRPTRFGIAKNSGQTLLILNRARPRQVPGSIPSATAYEPVTFLRPVTRPAEQRQIPSPQFTPPAPTGKSPDLEPQTNRPESEPLFVGQPVSGTVLPDLEQLQGVWTIVSENGSSPRTGGEQETRSGSDGRQELEFLKDRILSSDGTHGRIKLDESKSPKQIIIAMAGKSDDTLIGIYKIEGDRLTIASYSGPGKLMPTSFEPDSDAHVSIIVCVKGLPQGPRDEPRPRSSQRTRPAEPPAIGLPPPQIEPVPARPAPADLLKEINQLRFHLQLLEKRLKALNADPPPSPSKNPAPGTNDE